MWNLSLNLISQSAKNSCNENYLDVDSSNAECLQDLEEIDEVSLIEIFFFISYVSVFELGIENLRVKFEISQIYLPIKFYSCLFIYFIIIYVK